MTSLGFVISLKKHNIVEDKNWPFINDVKTPQTPIQTIKSKIKNISEKGVDGGFLKNKISAD